MTRATLLIVAAALGLASVESTARAQTPTPTGQPPTPQTTSVDGSGEAQGQGQMRTAVFDDEAARSHFRVGQLLYSEGRFADAAREFEQAYFLANRTQLLYNAYISYRDANDIEHAIITLDEYLRREPNLEDRVALQARLDSMRATYESQLSQQSNVAEERARLEQERAQFEHDAAEARARAEAAEREVARQRSPVPWVVGGAGLALLAGSGVSAIIANNAISSAEADCPDHVCPRDRNLDLDETRASIRRPALATDVLLGVGGATLVTGVVLLIVQRSGGDDEAAPTASASCDRYGCNTSLLVRF